MKSIYLIPWIITTPMIVIFISYLKVLLKIIQSYLNALKPFGCCSFSTNPKNLLMWSHYADEHKGLCIEYRTDQK